MEAQTGIGEVGLRLRAEFGAHRLSALWHQGIPQNTWAPIVFGVACFAVAFLSALSIGFAFGVVTVYAPYYPAILVATLVAGPRSGSTTLLLGCLPVGSLTLNPVPSTTSSHCPQRWPAPSYTSLRRRDCLGRDRLSPSHSELE